MKRALKDLNKDELLMFIYNHCTVGNESINIHDELAGCHACGKGYPEAIYGYECQDCQDENEEYHEDLKRRGIIR